MTRVLGLDLGISGARAAVLDGDGTRLGTGRAACDHRPVQAGVAEHDPRAWLAEIGAASAVALAEARVDRVDAVAVGALGPAPVLLDADLEPLLPAPLFSLDPRAERVRHELAARLGVDVGPDHVRPRVLDWAAREPAAVGRAAWVVDATGFVVSALTGTPVLDRVTAADHLLHGDDPPVPSPAPAEPLAIAGSLTDRGGALLGLRPGAAVAVGTYDTFVDVAVLPAGPGDVALLLGSTLVLGSPCAAGTPVPDGLRASPHVGDGVFVGGWTSTAGAALEWAAATFSGSGSGSGAQGSAVAALAPGDGGLVAMPYLAGERAPVWDPLARGALVGMTTSTTGVQLERAVLDGVALSARDVFTRLEPLLPTDPRVWAAGGGVRHAAWRQATADALGVPIRAVLGLADGGAAARFALTVLGMEVPVPEAEVVEPDPDRHARYLELAGTYAELYPALAATMHALGSLEGAWAS